MKGWLHKLVTPMLKANLKLFYVENAAILSKIIFSSAKIQMHIFNMLICEKFQIDYLKTLGRFDYTNFSFLKTWRMDGWTHRQGQNIMPPDYCHGGIKIIFSSSKSHVHILNRLVTFVQSFKLTAWKLKELTARTFLRGKT